MKQNKLKISVGLASCGIASGANDIYKAFDKIKDEFHVELKKIGCIGACYAEPLVEIKYNENETLIFANVEIKDLSNIINSVKTNKKHEKLFAKRHDGNILSIYHDISYLESLDYYKYQEKRLTKYCGVIDPENIGEYISVGGYNSFKKALNLKPLEIVEIVKNSGLRGRGGAGFPTGVKWGFIAQKEGLKYLICNFDEGDPGAFMNRVLVESNPHLLLEGMLITSYALGVKKAYVYTRAEYPLAVKRLEKAIKDAKKNGLLDKISSDFDIELRLGAGAFVCGEETALIKSIEGKAGRPVPKPPFPAQSGLFGNPTNINNVETLSNIPIILELGAKKYRDLGTKKSAGTKMFSFSGKVNRGGYIEVPFGITLNQIIEMSDNHIKDVKAIQLGGPSGGFITPKNFDLPIDYDSVKEVDAIVGSGSMVLISNNENIVEVVNYFLRFIASESCGKCVPCREGTFRMKEIIEKIIDKKASILDLLELEELARTIKVTALCGLGQTAPNPILSSIKHLKQDYLSKLKKVPIGSFQYVEIDESKCNGCDMCSSACPVKAISGKRLELHSINQEACIKCGHCVQTCKFGAIKIKNYNY